MIFVVSEFTRKFLLSAFLVIKYIDKVKLQNSSITVRIPVLPYLITLLFIPIILHFKNVIKMESYSMQHFVIGFFHSA